MTGDGRVEAIAGRLSRLLAEPLPGRAAHRTVWPDDLPGRLDPRDAHEYDDAAVLIALHHDSHGHGGFFFPLIRRPEGDAYHSGQIALPGGRCDRGETPCDCAQREAEEEIGLARGASRILGRLTPVPVSVSRNRIQPIVGWVEAASSPPRWRPQAGEVDSVLTADPDLLAAAGPARTVIRLRSGIERQVPAWIVEAPDGPATIWGATAIILAEFLTLWLRARS